VLVALPGVAQSLADARALIDRLLTSRSVVSRQAEVAAESAVRGARASVELDQAGSPDETLQGALRVSAELPRLRAVWRSSPRQALARLHLLAAADLTDPDLLGRPTDPVGAQALADVSELVLGSGSVPAVLVAALVHGDLLVAAPFAGANGIVARAASRLVLATKGLDPGLLGVPEVGHRELGDYAEAVASYRSGLPDGIGIWLRHCAGAVEAGAREALAVAEALARG
jgi:hypothetical protein